MSRWRVCCACAASAAGTLTGSCVTAQAVKELLALCARMRERWDVRKVAIAHRTGLVPVGEASVIIAVSSAHRREALEATQFGIEELKARARSVWFACACAV